MRQELLWAHAIGANALPGFFVTLVAVLVAVGAAWWALRRVVVPHQQSRLSPTAFIALRLTIGFAIVVLAGAMFAEIAEHLGVERRLGRIDQAIASAIHENVSRPTLEAFAWVTRLADVSTLTGLGVIVALALAWLGRYRLAAAWVFAVIGNALLNLALKVVFARVRPVHDHGLVLEQGFSFPSGHTSGSVVAYGMLAYVLVRLLPRPWHLPVVLMATALSFATGCSRVFLQVHFASDVIAGFAQGLAWLAVCITSVEGVRHYRRLHE
jgi:membrane-associated phospholipid phosphatase